MPCQDDAHAWPGSAAAARAGLQGLGIGSRLLTAVCARADAAGAAAYLETDKPINVRFYERFGFQVVGEQEILGVPNWFMWRPPPPVAGAPTGEGR